MRDPQNAHWRNSARSPKLFFIDAYATFPFLFLIFMPSMKTLLICVITVCVFGIISFYGFSIPMLIKFIRAKIAGDYRYSKSNIYRDSMEFFLQERRTNSYVFYESKIRMLSLLSIILYLLLIFLISKIILVYFSNPEKTFFITTDNGILMQLSPTDNSEDTQLFIFNELAKETL